MTQQHSASREVVLRLLQSCAKTRDILATRQVYTLLVKSGFDSVSYFGDHLIRLFAWCGFILEARDVVSWCALISGYVEYGHEHLALDMFEMMQGEGIKPDKVTFLSILKACGSLEFLAIGRLIHNHILQSGVKLDISILNTLMDMYLKCGSVREARTLYDGLQNPTAVSCGAMIAGYAQNGDGLQALKIYEFLKHEGLELTNSVYVSILKACKSIGAIDHGREVHDEVVQRLLEADILIGNTLIDFYSKCGYLLDACVVFQNLSNRNIVSWGVIITGCAENGLGLAALEYYEEMGKAGVSPDKVTFLGTLKACACLGAIIQGRLIHNQVVIGALEPDLAISSCLIDMYSSCGCLSEACKVFENCPSRDIAMWGAMIAGCAHQGACSLVEKCLQSMQGQGVKPNDELITSILSACNHASALDACRAYCEHVFHGGSSKVNLEHYSCIVNVLGRVGYLEEAAGLVHTMPIPPNIVSWTGLLTSCGIHGERGLGFRCFDNTINISPSEASSWI